MIYQNVYVDCQDEQIIKGLNVSLRFGAACFM